MIIGEIKLTLSTSTRLPTGIVTALAEVPVDADNDDEAAIRAGTAADGATIKEGSYLLGKSGQLMQITGGEARAVAIRQAKGSGGILARDAKIIGGLLPIRDAVREVLRAQATDQPWTEAQVRLRIAYSNFTRSFGAINHTVISVTADPEAGEERETHRRPNLAPFVDDPDCWLVASIEDYDLESDLARMGPIFRERVIAPPSAPLIATATDLTRRQSTRGDAFTLQIEGRTVTQRKAAGAALLTKVRLAARERSERSWTVGRIGGFDLTCDIQTSRHDGRLEPHLALERTDFPQSIGIDGETIAVGIIARLEHAVNRMDTEC